jgi:hypothetical protein
MTTRRVSSPLVRVILVFETLNIKAMHQLWGRKVGDLRLVPVSAQSQSMATKLGKGPLQIDRWGPTTQSCHLCQHCQQLPLNTRSFVCGACGDVEDHDVNAAYILDYLPVCPLGVLETGGSLGSGATRKTSQGFSGAITATAKFSCLIG